MNCALCLQPIAQGDAVNLHHPIYKSNGGGIWTLPPGLWLLENEVNGWTAMYPSD